LGKNVDAIMHLEHATQLNPKYDLAWLNLGIAYQGTGDKQKSRKSFEEYLKLAPKGEESDRIRAHLKIENDENTFAGGDTSTTDYVQSITARSRSPWPSERMPIKVFIADGSKMEGYKPEYLDLAQQAFADWHNAAPAELSYKFVDTPSGADITVAWIRDKAQIVSISEGGDTTYLQDGLGMKSAEIKLLLLDPAPQKLTPRLMRWITLHEVGHAFGLLGHSPSPTDIMYTVAPQTVVGSMPELSARDKVTISKFYTADIGTDWLALNDAGVDAAKRKDYTTALKKYAEAMTLTSSDVPRKNAVRSHYAFAIQLIQGGDMKSPEQHFKSALTLEHQKRDENFPILVEAYARYLRMLNRNAEASAIEKENH